MNIEISNIKKINQEYEIEKRYLINQLRRIREYSNELQSEKIRHVGEISHYKTQISNYADKRLRPFARRAARIRLPPTVAERERKPWRRLRTRTLG